MCLCYSVLSGFFSSEVTNVFFLSDWYNDQEFDFTNRGRGVPGTKVQLCRFFFRWIRLGVAYKEILHPLYWSSLILNRIQDSWIIIWTYLSIYLRYLITTRTSCVPVEGTICGCCCFLLLLLFSIIIIIYYYCYYYFSFEVTS